MRPFVFLAVLCGGSILMSCSTDAGPTGPEPTAIFTVTPNPGTTGSEFQFDASESSADQNEAIHSFGWQFGDTEEAEGAQVSHTYAEPGIYTVQLTVTDNSGRTATASRELEVLQEVELPTPDDIALSEEPSFLDDLIDRVAHPDDVYGALLQLDAPPALANFHLAAPLDLTPLGLGHTVYVPVQITPEDQDGVPPHGRSSLYFIEVGTEILSGVYLTRNGLGLRYTKRVTGEGPEARSGDVYSERIATVDGETIFQGYGELEILDPDIGLGQVELDRDANNVPLPDHREAKITIWFAWSAITIEVEEAEPSESEIGLPGSPPVLATLSGAVSGPDQLYETLREMGAAPRLLNFHLATPVDLSSKGLGAAVHVPIQIVPEADLEGLPGRKSIYHLDEGEDVVTGVYFTDRGLALRHMTRVRGETKQARTGDLYRERLVTRDGRVVHDAMGELEILDPDIGLGRIVLDRTPTGEALDPPTIEIWIIYSAIVLTSTDR